MSGGKARGGGESWHGRGAAPGTGTVPSLLQLFQQAEGCPEMLWGPCTGVLQGSRTRLLREFKTRILQNPVLLPPNSSSLTAPAPPATSSCSPLCTSNGPNRASTLSLAWEGCKSLQLLPVQGREGSGGCQGGIRNAVRAGPASGTVPAMSARPRGHLAGAGRPRLGGEPNLVGWSIVSLASLS